MRLGPPHPSRSFAAIVLLAVAGFVRPAAAQPEVRLGGQAFLDYYHQFASPDSARDGAFGFTFRRLYLTADARLSDAFSARARLEANDASLGQRGTLPFVKDLYLRWQSAGGHRLTLGIAPPPAFDLSDDVWGYRSLEKTLLDLNGVLASRDFGLRADGPIPVGREGLLRYGVMVGNNNGVFPEDDEQKRLYAQLQARPSEPVVVALGASIADYADERSADRALFAITGYVTDTWRAGVEGYLLTTGFDGTDNDLSGAGVSVFGAVEVAPALALVGRFDRARAERLDDAEPPVPDAPVATDFTTLALVGLAYEPAERVRLIPNLRWSRLDGEDDSDFLGRVTAEFSF